MLYSVSSFSEITSGAATIQDPQLGASAALGGNEGIAPYSCITLAEVHPQAPPTSEDPHTPSVPHLAPPNLVVDLPSERPETPPLLPPPRGRGLAKGDSWEMSYANLCLGQGLGWGNSGIVVKAELATDVDNQEFINRLARLEKNEGDDSDQWTVAVKRIRGEFIYC